MWTREAVDAAQPMEWPVDEIAPSSPEQPATLVDDASDWAAGGLPDPEANRVAQNDFPEDWEAIPLEIDTEPMNADADMPAGTRGVFTVYRANYFSQMYTTFPYRAVGRLTFRTPRGNSSCTASVISPNVIVTAAHCAYDTVNNRWYSNWAFTPAWRNGSAPYGTFSWRNIRVLSGWVNASGTVRRYDVALIRLGNNGAGRPVHYYTGYLGRSWNYSYTQSQHAFGYPSNLGSGRYTYACAAESFGNGTDVVGMGCNMTYGSSGGPWIRSFAPYTSGSVNYVSAVVSGGTPGTNTFYGPRFSSNNIVPLCAYRNGWGCTQ
jgi:V8-like Glu-specific endopeptidase